MIARMKKFTFLTYHRDYDTFLHELRDLGLIHVASSDRFAEDDGELNDLLSRLKQLGRHRRY